MAAAANVLKKRFFIFAISRVRPGELLQIVLSFKCAEAGV
jgi:hypothetical protein